VTFVFTWCDVLVLLVLIVQTIQIYIYVYVVFKAPLCKQLLFKFCESQRAGAQYIEYLMFQNYSSTHADSAFMFDIRLKKKAVKYKNSFRNSKPEDKSNSRTFLLLKSCLKQKCSLKHSPPGGRSGESSVFKCVINKPRY